MAGAKLDHVTLKDIDLFGVGSVDRHELCLRRHRTARRKVDDLPRMPSSASKPSLTSHGEWVETGGEKGQRADFLRAVSFPDSTWPAAS